MYTQRQINRLYRSYLRLTRAQFIVLKESVSHQEIANNLALRGRIETILHQLELIDELNRSFEF